MSRASDNFPAQAEQINDSFIKKKEVKVKHSTIDNYAHCITKEKQQFFFCLY